MPYIKQFLKLRCAGDVLNSVGTMNEPTKEISEAFGIIKHLRPIILAKPMTYRLVDFCSGNALVPIMASFVFPIKSAVAVDKKPNNFPFKHQKNVRNFTYVKQTIQEFSTQEFSTQEFSTGTVTNGSSFVPTILTAVHCCMELAKEVVEIYLRYDEIEHLILMPCCIGKMPVNTIPFAIQEKLGKHWSWAFYLNTLVNGKLFEDTNVLSPRNIIICASKKGCWVKNQEHGVTRVPGVNSTQHPMRT